MVLVSKFTKHLFCCLASLQSFTSPEPNIETKSGAKNGNKVRGQKDFVSILGLGLVKDCELAKQQKRCLVNLLKSTTGAW